jgi:serine/threonine protein kinase
MIHPHLSDNPEFVSRFESEAAAVAQLRHPNIVQVHDFDHHEGAYFMVLEYVPGETLQERLKRLNAEGRHMPPAEAVKYAIDVCEAAHYAHQRDMIHRDIKPANIMLDVYGQAILTDFGIAKILGGQQHTATGAVIGTARYMSPEQIQGKVADGRSDVYSIGVTLFEMVSGRPPYEADSAMTLMMMHLNDPIPDLRQIQSDAPAGLVAVIEKALAKNRDDRYQTAGEMARALEGALQAPASAPAPSPEATYVETPGTMPAPEATFVESAAAGARMGAAARAAAPQAGGLVEPGSGGPGIQPAASPPGAPPRSTLPYEGPHEPSSGPSKKSLNPVLIGAIVGVLLLICLAVGGVFAFNALRGDDATPVASGADSTDTPAITATEQPAELEPSATTPPTATSAPTETLPPTDTPTPTLSPTPTIPPGIPYVVITDIRIEGNYYVVEYETFEYTEQLPGMHVHFFYDTVPPEEAGSPGSGPWKLYGGPRPFTGYTTNSRPASATMMCALVANPNHSVQPDSGTCYPLPDVQTSDSANNQN